MALSVQPYDVADYLKSTEDIVSYLTEELESGEPKYMAKALGASARARGGIASLARQTGLPEEDVRRAVDEMNPDMAAILRLMTAWGVAVPSRIAA